VITNYVDPDETRSIDLGECRCPGTPHGRDSAQVVGLFSYGDRAVIWQAGRLGGVEAGIQMSILKGVRSWTLALPDGKPRPITAEQIARLDEGTVNALTKSGALNDAFRLDPLPKGPGARSLNGSRASAGSIPTIPTPTSSTPS
jgi:hypothetical protein